MKLGMDKDTLDRLEGYLIANGVDVIKQDNPLHPRVLRGRVVGPVYFTDETRQDIEKELLNLVLVQCGHETVYLGGAQFLVAHEPSDDPNDPILDMCHPHTFEPFSGPGKKKIALKFYVAGLDDK